MFVENYYTAKVENLDSLRVFHGTEEFEEVSSEFCYLRKILPKKVIERKEITINILQM